MKKEFQWKSACRKCQDEGVKYPDTMYPNRDGLIICLIHGPQAVQKWAALNREFERAQ